MLILCFAMNLFAVVCGVVFSRLNSTGKPNKALAVLALFVVVYVMYLAAVFINYQPSP